MDRPREARVDQLALAMVLGGALGNIVDRVRFGYVVDFADLHFGDFRPFLVFNVADAAISIGVVILLLRAFLIRERGAEEDYRTCVRPLPHRSVLSGSALARLRCGGPSRSRSTNSRSRATRRWSFRRTTPDAAGRRHRQLSAGRPDAGDRGLVRRPERRAARPRPACSSAQAGPRDAALGIRSTAGDPDTRVVDKGPTTAIHRRAGSRPAPHRYRAVTEEPGGADM